MKNKMMSKVSKATNKFGENVSNKKSAKCGEKEKTMRVSTKNSGTHPKGRKSEMTCDVAKLKTTTTKEKEIDMLKIVTLNPDIQDLFELEEGEEIITLADLEQADVCIDNPLCFSSWVSNAFSADTGEYKVDDGESGYTTYKMKADIRGYTYTVIAGVNNELVAAYLKNGNHPVGCALAWGNPNYIITRKLCCPMCSSVIVDINDTRGSPKSIGGTYTCECGHTFTVEVLETAYRIGFDLWDSAYEIGLEVPNEFELIDDKAAEYELICKVKNISKMRAGKVCKDLEGFIHIMDMEWTTQWIEEGENPVIYRLGFDVNYISMKSYVRAGDWLYFRVCSVHNMIVRLCKGDCVKAYDMAADHQKPISVYYKCRVEDYEKDMF